MGFIIFRSVDSLGDNPKQIMINTDHVITVERHDPTGPPRTEIKLSVELPGGDTMWSSEEWDNLAIRMHHNRFKPEPEPS